MLCPLGHVLQEFRTSADGWTCSVCKSLVEKDSTLYGCRSCDFDVCASCLMHEFDGCWVTSVGQAVVITGPCIKGSLSLFRSEGDGTCSMEIQGVRYYGKLSSQTCIEWDDGDIWNRDPNPQPAGAAPPRPEGPRAAAGSLDGPIDLSDLPASPEKPKAAASPSKPAGKQDARKGSALGAGRSLPKAPTAQVQPAAKPAPGTREQHQVAPQWAVAVDDDSRPPPMSVAPISITGNPVASLPPPPMQSDGDPSAGDRV